MKSKGHWGRKAPYIGKGEDIAARIGRRRKVKYPKRKRRGLLTNLGNLKKKGISTSNFLLSRSSFMRLDRMRERNSVLR